MSITVTSYGTNKPKNSRIHTINRAKERYNLDLNEGDIERLELRVRMQHEVFFLERKTNSRSVWLMEVYGKMVVAVYNTKQKCIATFLPLHYAKRYINEFDYVDVSDEEIGYIEKRIKKQHHDVFFLERNKKFKTTSWLCRSEDELVLAIFDLKSKKITRIQPAVYSKKYFNINTLE